MLPGPLCNVSIPAGGALAAEQAAESLQHLGIAILEDLRNLIPKDAFKKMELVFYRQLCHLGPEIQVTLTEEKANYGPHLGIGRLFRITRRHVEVTAALQCWMAAGMCSSLVL